MIKVIGLGVTDGDLSIRGAVAINEAETIIVKTALAPTYAFFSEYSHITCDYIYESANTFEDLDTAIASLVMSNKDKKTVYCVNGSGYDDRSVILLKQLYPNLEILPSVSRDCSALDKTPAVSYFTMSAYDFADGNKLNYDSNYQLVIRDIDNQFLASTVKELLSTLVGDEVKINYVHQGITKTVPLYELDHLPDYDYTTMIAIPPQKLTEKEVYNFADLMRIMAMLRGDNGCHWDKEQDHKSIRSNMIEEAYELVEAINNDDIDNIIEECGDVILQGVFHTIIGEDEGEFLAHEVLTTLCKKLISRHTHIFGKTKANNAAEALNAWENAKAIEKSTTNGTSKMLSVAKALPSLMRAEKVQKIAAKYRMDFTSTDQISHKVLEELREFIKTDDKEDEGGDLLFSVVNLLRFHGVKSEVALTRAVDKFLNRFSYIESHVSDMTKVDEQLLDKLWNEAKNHENR